jgi:transcriptional regulator with XRE-family HTH domain
MDAAELIALRKRLGLTQTELGRHLGVALRTVQEWELGSSRIRTVHVAAVERVALEIAVERGEPMLAPPGVRRQALELARLITGRPAPPND